MKKKQIDALEASFKTLKEYHQEHGTVVAPLSPENEKVRVALQIAIDIYHSNNGALPNNLKRQFESIGMVWDHNTVRQIRTEIEAKEKMAKIHAQKEEIANRQRQKAEQKKVAKILSGVETIKQYYKEHMTIMPITDKLEKDPSMLSTLDKIVDANLEGRLPLEEKNKLDEMGMIWDKSELRRAADKAIKDASWDNCYEVAKQYYKVFGNLSIPKQFEMFDVKLGEWLAEQKEAYADMTLSIDRAQRLSEIGCEWDDTKNHVSYDESIIAYYVSKCFPDTINSYRPPELRGMELDVYIPSLKIGIEFDGAFFHSTRQRQDQYKNDLCKENGIKMIRVRPANLPRLRRDDNCTIISIVPSTATATSRRKTVEKVLQSIGVPEDKMPSIDVRRDKYEITGIMVEDKTFFKQYLMAAENFARSKGHLLVPKDYQDPTGLRLGEWIVSIRNSRQWLTERQKNALDDIGMVWRGVKKEKWLTNFEMARSFGSRIPNYATTTDGNSLKEWYEQQKQDFKDSKITEDYKLDAMKKLRIRDKNRETEER